MDTFKKDLILLNMVQDIGYKRFRVLLDRFKTPRGILEATANRLKSVKGIGDSIALAIEKAGSDYDINQELALIKDAGIDIITLFDDNYPANLRNIYDPPLLLYVKGTLEQQDNAAIAIVGSRRCSYYGRNIAEKISSDLVEYQVTIVSGLARGIDTASHQGAINNNGRTIAVLGSGIGCIYPIENKALAQRISLNGAIVSEFPMKTKPYKQNFPRRNRVISGLSKAVLVVEAAQRSGALITADFALEQGRDVFAIPGMAGRASSAGTNALIKQGAGLVDNVNDILDGLNLSTDSRGYEKTETPKRCEGLEKDIYEMLSGTPCHIDIIMQRLGSDKENINLALFYMQTKGVVKQMPGGYYLRNRA
jgi:DNA processing protein